MPKINVTVKWSGKKFDDIELGKFIPDFLNNKKKRIQVTFFFCINW